eukprot:13877707-Heterocapsa_arctica.AAC.1
MGMGFLLSAAAQDGLTFSRCPYHLTKSPVASSPHHCAGKAAGYGTWMCLHGIVIASRPGSRRVCQHPHPDSVCLIRAPAHAGIGACGRALRLSGRGRPPPVHLAQRRGLGDRVVPLPLR